jgi:hypothetical protein
MLKLLAAVQATGIAIVVYLVVNHMDKVIVLP